MLQCKAFIQRLVPALPPLDIVRRFFVANIAASSAQQTREIAVQCWRVNSISVRYFSAFFWCDHYLPLRLFNHADCRTVRCFDN